jgi:uncharacterized membrane protein YdjX (TVP38/TMEM64 family)
MNNKSVKIVIAIALISLFLLLAKHFGWRGWINTQLQLGLEWIDNLGWWGAIAFIFLYIIATVFLIPGSILTLGAGVIYKLFWGTILVSVASTISATIAFILGRYLVRDWVLNKFGKHPNFQAIDGAISREGWKIVALTRLSPVFPFNFLNYLLSLTHISIKDYFFASWMGMIPGTIMYVYIGSAIGNLATLASNNKRATTPMEWALYLVGLVATIVLTVYITKLAQKALTESAGISLPRE